MKIQPLLERISTTIKTYVDRGMEQARSEAKQNIDLAFKQMPVPKDGKDGRDAPPVDVPAIVKGILDQLPVPKDGADGKDAEPVDYVAVIAEVAKQIQVPKDGRDGIDGKSVTPEDVRAMLDEIYTQKQAAYALDFEKRAQERLDRFMERIPAPKDGKDGRDAIDVEGFDMSLDGRDLTVSLKRGDAVIATKSIRVPGFEDRGVYRDTEQYEKGDGVSFGGSFFIAQKDAPEGKPEQSRAWRCVVKRGRDGKDGRNGIDKTSSVKVP